MPNFVKELMVKELGALAQEATSCVLVDFRGLSAEEAAELRRLLREKGVRMIVVNNRLYRRALAECFGSEVVEEPAMRGLFQGPTAVVFGSDGAVSAAKVLLAYRTEHEQLGIKGGLLERRPVGPEAVEELSTLPSREAVLGQVAAAVLSPLTTVAYFLNAVVSDLALLCGAIGEKLRESEKS